ncbi:hypothetical protein CC658_04220 [Salmonella enterica subsp. enterica serovar Koketime]|uniref:Uncharacterized protein n=2 Tax=Salmonella enterica TaxID=28901 RepID=A0A749S241_SALER|nr:hypothetical protein [Salmonella enterica subsp. enterica serovar Koketime]EAM8929957.1 hypothetical protein [Salmonella enterica]EBB4437368.1 hypothetical protein [Salmonella enterica]EBR9058484.1 hypothetical protein [Salmonella enterica subsp. enterica serovar Koketime]EBV0082672.1 hypothetical protein [Salmonella enterica subsp. enterica serovar Koketime]
MFHQSNHLTFIVHKNQQVVFRKNNVLDKRSARHADRQKHNGLTSCQPVGLPCPDAYGTLIVILS